MDSKELAIVSWKYSTQEWDQFVAIEKKNKLEDNVYVGIGILILGTAGLMFFRKTSIWMALLFAVPLSILLPALRMLLGYPHLKKGVQNPNVAIFKKYLLINGKKIETQEKGRSLKSVKILAPKKGVTLLEFDIWWGTSKGKTGDQFRIPIPKNQEDKAERIIELLR
jgi:hypothetical protein